MMHKGDKRSISVNHLCQDKDEQHKQDTNVLKYDNIYRKHDKLALFEKKSQLRSERIWIHKYK